MSEYQLMGEYQQMSDDLRTRIIAAIARADQDWCSDNNLHEDMADAVIEALPDYLWRCPKCSKGYWADHGPICNVTPPPWGSGR